MSQEISDRRDMDFTLYEQLEIESLLASEKFDGMNRKVLDMVVNEARNLAVKELLPINASGDREGCRFENGVVKVPESFHRAFRLFREGEWITLFDDPKVGGQGLPVSVSLAISEYFNGANCSFCTYPGLCHGAGKLIEVYGTDDQKNLFLSNMYTGKWGGSMLLTEPGAGSDVGALTTTATRNPDGTFSISGSKIFITAGEQNLTENIIHPVLARIEGAPAGIKGISIFIVPKIRVNPDGSLGDPNDVICTGIEEKMGIHGSATCSLTLGGKGKCQGLLLAEFLKKNFTGFFKSIQLDIGFSKFRAQQIAQLKTDFIQQLNEEIFLVFEIKIYRAHGYLGRIRDTLHTGLVIALCCKQGFRRT